ncbi:MAG: aldehyde dehydrogenase family protein, partial [Egibacteraceae bacterium]
AYTEWRATTMAERVSLIRELAARLRAARDDLALLEARDTGNPVTAMAGDIGVALAQMEYFAGLALEQKGETVPASGGGLHLTVREPYGVVAKIIAFNHPLMFAAGKIVPPLLAGNAVVLKPSPVACLSALEFGRLVADVVPPGLLNILTGAGSTVGQALVADPRVRRIALIGSAETGKAIQRAAADHLAHVTLELGGKNPMIVFPDADPAQAARAAVAAMNFTRTQAQSCGSSSRLYLHRDVAPKVLEYLEDEIAKIRMGPTTDSATEMGAIVSRRQYERILDYIESAKQEGARLIVGGGRPQGQAFARGFFIEPTVFVDVQPGMRIAREEVFGPVLSVMEWQDEDEVIRAANDTDYGLTANVWTKDLDTALRVFGRLEAGYLWVNGRGEHFLGLPYGGYKASGIGREEALEELLSYSQVKSLSLLRPR